MTLKEELEKNQISNNYFNLLSKKSHYSGSPFKHHNLYIQHITRKLKQKYPTLTDESCKVISNCGLVGNGYTLSDIIILDNSIFKFINHEENENPYYCYGISVHQTSCYYRNIDSEYFLYNLDKNSSYKAYRQGKLQIVNPNDTGLEEKEELEYTHFLASSITQFLKEQEYEIEVKPVDQKRSNKEIYNNGHLSLDWRDCCISYHLFVNCNFISLAKAYAKKENIEMDIALFKGKSLEVAARLHQHFDEVKKCMIEINSVKKEYFSLNEGHQETVIKNTQPTNMNIKEIKKVMAEEKVKKKKNRSSSVSKRKYTFPYYSILIDQEIKDDLIKVMPKITTIPISTIPNFQNDNHLIEYFYQVSEEVNKENKKALLITKNQKNIICCHNLKIDTCFINTGVNDMIDYNTTYEVSDINQIPQIKIKNAKSKTYKK